MVKRKCKACGHNRFEAQVTFIVVMDENDNMVDAGEGQCPTPYDYVCEKCGSEDIERKYKEGI